MVQSWKIRFLCYKLMFFGCLTTLNADSPPTTGELPRFELIIDPTAITSRLVSEKEAL
jgi:hypothetical protein